MKKNVVIIGWFFPLNAKWGRSRIAKQDKMEIFNIELERTFG